MCEFLTNLFKSLTNKTLTLPHPEESEGGIGLEAAFNKWVIDWQVSDPAYWEDKFRIDDSINCPAQTIGNQVQVQTKWTNPGVLAHESAHVIYPLIDSTEFETEFDKVLTDSKIVLLYQMGKISNIVENHAEIYRYWGKQMPESLLRFYPKLI